jgi:phosphopantothenoylcysteine decarboxylase/phosphopantothenate--cysteine ligase
LTNFSTGTLGIRLANHLIGLGGQVSVLKGYYAITPELLESGGAQTFTTTADLEAKISALSGSGLDAIYHAAAVSDFRFGQVFAQSSDGSLTPVQSGKFSTRGEPLLAQLEPAPKILPKLREWFPRAFIAGWKYEADGSREQALDKGRAQIATAGVDLTVVNGPAYGEGFGLVDAASTAVHCPSQERLFAELAARSLKKLGDR